MNIIAATLTALENDCAVTYPRLHEMGIAVLPETSLSENYYAVIDIATQKQIGRRWAPEAQDILSDDWTLLRK